VNCWLKEIGSANIYMYQEYRTLEMVVMVLVLASQTYVPSGYGVVYSVSKIFVICISSVLPQLAGMR
jgi:hypothetical protein